MKLSKFFVGLLALIGISLNSYSVDAQSVLVDNVLENSPIVLKQNDVIQHSFNVVDSDNTQYMSHSSHYSHASHTSHYSYAPQNQ